MFDNVVKPREQKKTYRCPCCKFKTLYGRSHYELCPVCYWEDDGQDEHDAGEVRGGPNGSLSLHEAQSNFRNFGAMEEQFKSKVRKPYTDEL